MLRLVIYLEELKEKNYLRKQLCIDTVVNSGHLDGQYGILAALTAMEYLVSTYGQPKRFMEVISLAEEEGSRFPTVFWGSKNFVGEANNQEVAEIDDANGLVSSLVFFAAR